MSNDWRSDAATEKQKEKLRFFGCIWDEGITKGQASDAIDECIKKFPDIEAAYQNRPATEDQLAKLRDCLQPDGEDPDDYADEGKPLTYRQAKDLIWECEREERTKQEQEEDDYWKSEEGQKEQEWSRLNAYWPGAVREVTPEEFDEVWDLVKSRKTGQPTPGDLVDAVKELFPDFREKPQKPGALNYFCYRCRGEIEVHFSKTNKTISYTGRDETEILIAKIDDTLTHQEFLKNIIKCPHCGRDSTLCPP